MINSVVDVIRIKEIKSNELTLTANEECPYSIALCDISAYDIPGVQPNFSAIARAVESGSNFVRLT